MDTEVCCSLQILRIELKWRLVVWKTLLHVSIKRQMPSIRVSSLARQMDLSYLAVSVF
jgi:hypothetical protein